MSRKIDGGEANENRVSRNSLNVIFEPSWRSFLTHKGGGGVRRVKRGVVHRRFLAAENGLLE